MRTERNNPRAALDWYMRVSGQGISLHPVKDAECVVVEEISLHK